MTSLIFMKVVGGIVLLCLLCVAIAWYHASVKDAGYAEAEAHYEARIAQLDLLAQRRLQEAQAKVRRQTDELRNTIAAIEARRTHEQKAADETIQTLRRDIASGARRVSIPAAHRTPLVPVGASRADSAPVTRTEPKAGCELDPAAAETLVDIARRGDEAIRNHAAVVDAYEAARATVSAPAGQQ